ncbi:MAG TPA: cytochrome D1 domain-containing protein [Gaiellaceae bacterium]
MTAEVIAPPAQSPYKGLARYEEADAPYFFGRDADAELVVANLLAARLTLLFGESGVGKSSLLHAGVAPRLREDGDIALVLFSDWRGDVAASLRSALLDAAGCGEGSVSGDLATTIETCAGRSGRDLVVILDQTEEYFVYHESGGDAFARELPAAVARADLPVSFLIAIREDALARLELFKGRIPALFDTYLRLDRLGRAAAREAIVAPLERYASLHPDAAVTAEPQLVERLLDQVEVGRVAFGGTGVGVLDGARTANGGEGERSIEAPYLQLVLARLWDEERRAGSRELRLETLERLGGAERIIRTHLDLALDGLSAAEQKTAAAIFRYLVTPSGTKIAHRVDDLAEYSDRPRAAVASVLAELATGETRVVRPVGEDSYEIYHDVLAAAVLDWRSRHLHAQELAAVERKRRHRLRLALAALAVTFLAGAAAGVAIWRVQADRANDARRQAETQMLEVARAALYYKSIYAGHHDPVRDVAFSLDGRRAVSVDLGGNVRIWETDSGRELAGLHSGGELYQVDFSPDGSLVVAAGAKGNATVWRWRTGDRVAQLHEPSGFNGASFGPGGTLVVLPGDDANVRLWDWRAGRVVRILDAPGYGYVNSAAMSRDGRFVVAGHDDGQVRVWDWRRQRILADLQSGTSVPNVAFSPDGRFVASGGQDGIVRVWDWRARRPVWSTRVADEDVTGVAFSPDGALVAASSEDDTARIWDWRRNRLVTTLRGHTDEVRSVAFSPNGCLVATAGGYDLTARIWAPPLAGCRR